MDDGWRDAGWMDEAVAAPRGPPGPGRDKKAAGPEPEPQPLAMSSPAALREGYEHFDPRAYLRNNYLPPRADFSSEEFVVPWKLRCLAETFASGEEKEARIPPPNSRWDGETEAQSPRRLGDSSSGTFWCGDPSLHVLSPSQVRSGDGR